MRHAITIMRTSKQDLQKLVDAISEKQGRPSAELRGDMKTGVRSNPGALRLDHNAYYGGWDLLEYTNDRVCDASLIGNTFAGRGRLKAHEMESFLLGMLAAINGSEYFKPDFSRYGGNFATQRWVEVSR